MKPKWNDKEIQSFLNFVEENNKKNKPLLHTFKEYAKISNRQPLSVRNFYYSCLKMIKNNKILQKKYQINLNFHNISKFEHFKSEEEGELKNKVESLIALGYSVRNACIELSNGDMKKMLRIQNKYRNILEKKKQLNKNIAIEGNYKNIKIKNNSQSILKFDNKQNSNKTTVYKFPVQNTTKSEKVKLSDEDIKSLFMGLVNLVKENAKSDSQQKYEAFLQRTEEDKRKHVVELEQKQFEIDRLNQSINELKAKNTSLNKCLEDYRINYLNNQNPQN